MEAMEASSEIENRTKATIGKCKRTKPVFKQLQQKKGIS